MLVLIPFTRGDVRIIEIMREDDFFVKLHNLLEVQGSSLARRADSLVKELTPPCLSSQRCKNGYRRHSAGG